MTPLPDSALSASERDASLDAMASELERLRSELRAVTERVHELDAFRTRFVDHALHEMKHSLTALSLQVYMLKEATLDPAARRRVEMIDRLVRGYARLIEDTFDAARLQAGRLPLHLVPVAASDAVHGIKDSFGSVAEDKGVALDIDVSDRAVIRGDPSRLQQALGTLVSNAIMHTPRGGRVSVKAHAEDGHVVLRVTDTGVGMGPAQVEGLFTPFSGAARPGAGLGLCIAKGIIEGHRGSIQVTSEGSDRGTTFVVRLPSEKTDGE